jgi:hypothetical protein
LFAARLVEDLKTPEPRAAEHVLDARTEMPDEPDLPQLLLRMGVALPKGLSDFKPLRVVGGLTNRVP